MAVNRCLTTCLQRNSYLIWRLFTVFAVVGHFRRITFEEVLLVKGRITVAIAVLGVRTHFQSSSPESHENNKRTNADQNH